MTTPLTAAYLNELKQGLAKPNVIIEAAFDEIQYLADGTYLADGSIEARGSVGIGNIKWGFNTGGFNDVDPVLTNTSSLQNKIDPKGYTNRGNITVTITGREHFKNLIQDNFLMNRRIIRKEGFNVPGFSYADYAETFTGTIVDWQRSGDNLTLIIADDMKNSTLRLPLAKEDKTQYMDLRNTNPYDMALIIFKDSDKMAIDAAYVDTVGIESERDTWFPTWKFDRVLTRSEDTLNIIKDLQIETGSHVVHDGAQITIKSFSPLTPGQIAKEWIDEVHILKGSIQQNSGYINDFYTRVLFYYDYDESGNDSAEDNYESVHEAVDLGAQSPSEWDETRTKIIKAKYVRTRTYDWPVNIFGVIIFHVSFLNGLGTGTLSYNNTNKTLSWKAPGATGAPAGDPVEINKSGKYQLFDASRDRYIRVVVNVDLLPGADRSDTITITALSGDTYAAAIATRLLRRYSDPVSTISCAVDKNEIADGTAFHKPTDIVDITTDEACSKSQASWDKERMMIISWRPDLRKDRIMVSLMQTRQAHRVAYIAPAGFPTYPTATNAQREYAFVGDVNNRVNGGADDGYYII